MAKRTKKEKEKTLFLPLTLYNNSVGVQRTVTREERNSALTTSKKSAINKKEKQDKMISPAMLVAFFQKQAMEKVTIPLIEKNIIRFIRSRIFNLHKVKGGNPAAHYTASYAKSKKVGVTDVDLKVTGQLLNSLVCKYKKNQSTLSDGVAGVVTTVGVFEIYSVGSRRGQSITNAELARVHNFGVPSRKLPARPFLELTASEVNHILLESFAGRNIPDAIF